MFKGAIVDHGYLVKNNIQTADFLDKVDETYTFWSFANNKLLSSY